MNDIPQAISITQLRHNTRDVIQKVIRSDDPIYIIYNSQIPACLVSTNFLKGQTKDKKTVQHNNLVQYVGFLKNTKAYGQDSVAYQRRLREEWD